MNFENIDFKRLLKKNKYFMIYAGVSLVVTLVFVVAGISTRGKVNEEQKRFKQNIAKIKQHNSGYSLNDASQEKVMRRAKSAKADFEAVFNEAICVNNCISEGDVQGLKEDIETKFDTKNAASVLRGYYRNNLVPAWKKELEENGVGIAVITNEPQRSTTVAAGKKEVQDIDFGFTAWAKEAAPIGEAEAYPIMEQFLVVSDLIGRFCKVSEKYFREMKLKESADSATSSGMKLIDIKRFPLENLGSQRLTGDKYFVQREFYSELPLQFTIELTTQQLADLITMLEQEVPGTEGRQRLFIIDNVSLATSDRLSDQIKKTSDGLSAEIAKIKDGLIFRDNYVATNPNRKLRAVFSVRFVNFKKPVEKSPEELDEE